MPTAKPLDSVSIVYSGTQELYTMTDGLCRKTSGRTGTLLLVEDEPVAQLRGESVLSGHGSAFHIAGDEAASINKLEQLFHSTDGKVEIWLDNTFPTANGDYKGSHAILQYIINNGYQNRVRIVTFGGSEEENLEVIRMCMRHNIPIILDSRTKNEKLRVPQPIGLNLAMQTVTTLLKAANDEGKQLPLAA